MADKLTVKERKLVRNLVDGKKPGQAAREAGYSRRSANARACEALARPRVITALTKALDKAGLSDTRLAKKHAELLDAQKTISAVCGKDAGAGTVDFVDVPDHQTQLRALDIAYKVKGYYVERVDMEHSGVLEVRTVDGAIRTKNSH